MNQSFIGMDLKEDIIIDSRLDIFRYISEELSRFYNKYNFLLTIKNYDIASLETKLKFKSKVFLKDLKSKKYFITKDESYNFILPNLISQTLEPLIVYYYKIHCLDSLNIKFKNQEKSECVIGFVSRTSGETDSVWINTYECKNWKLKQVNQ